VGGQISVSQSASVWAGSHQEGEDRCYQNLRKFRKDLMKSVRDFRIRPPSLPVKNEPTGWVEEGT